MYFIFLFVKPFCYLSRYSHCQLLVSSHRGLGRMAEVVLEPLVVAQMGVKPSEQRSVLFLEESQVPLAHGVSAVADRPQVLGQQLLLKWQPPGLCFQDHQVLHSCTSVVSSRYSSFYTLYVPQLF